MTVTPVQQMPRWFGSRTVWYWKGIHPQNHLAGYSGVLQADVYGGYRALYESGRITEAACMAHARRKIHDVHARAPTYITTEALQRIGELYAIEAGRGCSAEQRLAARKATEASFYNGPDVVP